MSPADLIKSSSSTPASCTVVLELARDDDEEDGVVPIRPTVAAGGTPLLDVEKATSPLDTGVEPTMPWATRAARVVLMVDSSSPGWEAARPLGLTLTALASTVGAEVGVLPPPPQALSNVATVAASRAQDDGRGDGCGDDGDDMRNSLRRLISCGKISHRLSPLSSFQLQSGSSAKRINPKTSSSVATVNAETQHSITLDSVLRVMRPLVRLLLRHGITYPAFAAALKRVFLDAAHSELTHQGMARTDSALTLLSGVHRRDVRELRLAQLSPSSLSSPSAPSTRPAAPPNSAAAKLSHARPPLSVAGEVMAHWLSVQPWLARNGRPRHLPRFGAVSFDALVASVSQDVRPRAMLDELLRLGAVTESETGIALVAGGFAPREGFVEMSTLFADNLTDHAAAAAANLQGDRNFLEQAVYVDQLSAESAARLQQVAAQVWRQAMKTVMAEAQLRFDGDARLADPQQRNQRARFGVYFYSEPEGS